MLDKGSLCTASHASDIQDVWNIQISSLADAILRVLKDTLTFTTLRVSQTSFAKGYLQSSAMLLEMF